MSTRISVGRLAAVGMLIALAVIGSFIKLGPASIAFDAAAGFVAAMLLGPAAGAAVCSLGHLAVALTTGFPLGPVFHLLTAVAMAGVGALGGLAADRFGKGAGHWAAAVVLVIANGIGAPALLALVPQPVNPMGTGLFAALWIPLTLAAGANAAVAALVSEALRRTRLVA